MQIERRSCGESKPGSCLVATAPQNWVGLSPKPTNEAARQQRDYEIMPDIVFIRSLRASERWLNEFVESQMHDKSYEIFGWDKHADSQQQFPT